MRAVRRLMMEVALWTVVISFLVFWVTVGAGIERFPIYAAFTTFAAASILLMVSPSPTEEDYCLYLNRKNGVEDEPLVIDVDICVWRR